jgi:hypothetical protein
MHKGRGKSGYLVLGGGVELIPAGGALDAGGFPFLHAGTGREGDGEHGQQNQRDQLLHHFTSFRHQVCTIGFALTKHKNKKNKTVLYITTMVPIFAQIKKNIRSITC